MNALLKMTKKIKDSWVGKEMTGWDIVSQIMTESPYLSNEENKRRLINTKFKIISDA